MVWRLETQRSSHAQRQPATAVPASSGTAVSDGGADAASSSCISGSHTSSSPTGGDVSFPSGDGTGGSSAVRSSPQQPEVSRHSAKEEVAAWASYRLVCRRWNDHFRSQPWRLYISCASGQWRFCQCAPADLIPMSGACHPHSAEHEVGVPQQAQVAGAALRRAPQRCAAELAGGRAGRRPQSVLWPGRTTRLQGVWPYRCLLSVLFP